MRTGSLTRRTAVAALAVLLLALGGFATLTTLRYRNGLRSEARTRLLAGGRALQVAPVAQIKPLIASLALEGVGVEFSPAPAATKPGAPLTPPVKPGALSTRGHLLTLSQPVPALSQTATLSISEASVDSAVNRLIITELIGAGAAVLLAGLVMALALRSALRPLHHVAAVAQRIAAGDRRQRLLPRRRDTELGRMAASFDAMVDSLEEAVTQATRSEAAMRRFLADASHELRTPIAALQATAETLLREQPPRPRRDQLEAELARGTERLGRLVDDLLNLARLQANEPLRNQRVDLAQIGESLVTQSSTRTAAEVSLTHEGPAVVMGDPDALARALRNLLDNAVRAVGEQGRIVIALDGSEHRVRATVTDDGPGVPAHERERIFEGFVRLSGNAGAGTGLGLAVTRAIAQQHHGSVTCEACEAGARFTLELPAAAHPESRDAQAPSGFGGRAGAERSAGRSVDTGGTA